METHLADPDIRWGRKEDLTKTTLIRLVRENILEVEAACSILPSTPPCADDLLKADRVAEMLAISPRTLENWRAAGNGPPVLRIEGMVRYMYRDLLIWLNEQANK